MARNTGSQLRVSFLVDTGGLRSGFQKATRETDRFGKASTRSARATAGLGSALRGAALAAGGAAAAYISIAQARQAITTTQELALATMGLERNLGLATKEASRWAAVTRARGVDSKTLTMSFTALSRAIDGTRTGTESALRPFQALGISQKELTGTGGDFQKQILLVADALGEAEGSAGRQAAAAKLLGRGYRDILPLFSEGAKGLQEQLRWADEFGATMGKDTVQAMSDFTTAQRRGRVAIMGLQIAFARFATPAITEAIEGIGNFAAVLNDPSLTKAQKLAQLRQEFERLQDRVISIVRDLIPIVAQSAGEIGVALAQGIARGFLETGILGKVAISAFFIRAMGGPRAIMAAGASVGSIFSAGMASATAASGTFGLARSFGRGRTAAAAAAAGSLAMGLGKSLARAIPPVMATLAIGDILLTAIAGDLRGAAMKGGGAVIGGAIGALFGPAGIAVGAGLGAIGGGIIQDIVGGAEKEAPKMRDRIAAAVGRLAAAADREQGAYRRLQSASDFAVDSRRRQKAATDRVREAEAKLAQARARFGPNSEEAIKAERRLARAKGAVARATERVKNAERVYGTERRATKVLLRASVKDQKVELTNLRMKQQRIARLLESDRDNVALNRQYMAVTKAVDKGQRQLNRSYLEAGQKVGPKFANSLRRIDGRAESLRRAVGKLRAGVKVNTRDMSRAYRTELEAMLRKTSASVQVLSGDGAISIVGTGAGGASGPVPRRRRGGSITGSRGRSVLAAVSPGEMITHRGREVMVPGRPEPRDSVLMNLPVGSKVFTADGQARLAMGASEAQALRDQAPHFAEGGIVRPQMVGGIPGPRRVANKGFGRVHKEALAYIERNSLADLAGAERLAAKFGLRVSSGYRPGDDGWHGVNRARDFAGDPSDMYRFAKYVGTRFESKLLELIYSPLGWSIDNYRRVPPYAVADHYDHVHLAMRKGGRISANSPLRKKQRWGPNALHTLAAAVGMPNPGLMAQIAQGESGGRANLNNAGLNSDGSVDYGLWQINSIHGKPVSGMLNPIQNAFYAKEILARQGLGAWVAYTNGRYAGFSPGQFDEQFYWDLIYSGKSQRRALGAAKRKAGRIPALRKAFRTRGGKAGTGRKLTAAKKAARKAVRLARLGNVGESRAAGRRATRLTRAAAKGINAPGGGGNNDEETRPARDLSYLGLPDSVLRRMPFEDRVALLERDLAQAGLTASSADDLAVLNAQIRLYSGLRARSLKTIARTNRGLARISPGEIARARKMAKSKNKETRKKGRRLLAKYRGLISDRSDAIANLGRADSEIASANEAKGDVGGQADLAEAMAELAEAIREQNEIQKGVQGTSSREALRLLSDVISGQIVGKRVSSAATPQGVRY